MGLITSTEVESSSVCDNTRKYGWVRDLPDHRDRYHEFKSGELKPTLSLKISNVPIYNQGHLGSCTANAIACAYQYNENIEELKNESTPSRLFIYYNERVLEGTTGTDSGAQIRDGIKTIVNTGVCPEIDWPYNIDNFTDKPYPKCYAEAQYNKATEYKRVEQDIEQLKLALANGFPIIFGITVYSSFESEEAAETGNIPMPGLDEKLLGGHAITLYGYDDDSSHFLFRNSWGEEWGNKGNGTLPYGYVLNPNLASDFWTVTKVVEELP